MKHLSLFVAVLLLTVGVISVGFAGKATTGVKATQTVASTAKLVPLHHEKLTDSDISGVRPQGKSSAVRQNLSSYPASTYRPVPEVKSISGAPLAGTYSIPSAAYPYIGAAIADLNANGLSADVEFELTAAAYYEYPITVGGSYPGAGTYKVTIKPATGVNAVINFTSLNVNGKGFAFVGAKNFEIDGVGSGTSLTMQYGGPLSVFPLGDPFAATVYITGASQDIALKNAVIKGQVNNVVWASQTEGRPCVFVFTQDATGDLNYNITIDGCQMTEGTYGVKTLDEFGNYGSVAGLTINNSRFGPDLVIGGLYEMVANVVFTNNVMDGITYLVWYWNNLYTEYDVDAVFGTNPFMYGFGQSTGAHFLLVDNGLIKNNIFRNIGTDAAAGDGILTYGSRTYAYNLFGLGGNAWVENNLFYNLTNPGGGGSQINGLRGPAGYVYHNSIRLTGVTAAGSTTNCVNGVTAAYNNAFSNEMTGPTASNRRAIAQGGTFDYNAVFSNSGYFFSGLSSAGAAVAAGLNPHGVFGPVNFDANLTITTGPSSAEDVGRPDLPVLTDFAGNPVDTTAAGLRDAGAYQFNTGVLYGPDVMAAGINSPPGNVPTNLAQIPTVTVKNNTVTDIVAPFNITLTEPGMSYSQTVPVPSLAKGASITVSFPSWTPTAPAAYTFTATVGIAGDVDATNDVVTKPVNAQSPKPIVTNYLWNWEAGNDGWVASTGPGAVTDWKLKSTFTKLGGPYAGSSWVTERPTDPSTYTEGAYANTEGYSSTYPGANILESQWLDLSGMVGPDVYVSFFQSINLEPNWDLAYMEYTVDGVNWKHLGSLNDPNGINWYNESVYANAKAVGGDPPDTVTMKQYGLIKNGSELADFPNWTSNGDWAGADVPTGPNGWVFNQLHITAATYPLIMNAPVIKFRYVAFSDAVGSFGGWAIDNFYIGTTGTVLSGGTIAGTAFLDANGNGINDAEAPEAGLKIYISYFGALKDSVVTDGSGNYSWNLSANSNLPGVYNLQCVKDGYAFTVPFNATGKVDVNHSSDGSTITQNFGIFQGSISGTVFDDVNDNGVKDAGEGGLANYIVEVHKDSLGGVLVGNAVTPASGAFAIPTPPGTFVVHLVYDNTISRKTLPAGDYTATITPPSGSGTAIVTGQDFGLFLFGTITTAAYVDYNGNGVKDLADNATLPGATFEVWRFEKVGGSTVYDTLGNGDLTSVSHPKLDVGTYIVKLLGSPTTDWTRTFNPDSVVITLATSNLQQTVYVLDFKLNTVSGNIYEDANGSGAKDGGEGDLAGITVNLTGAGGGTTLTDAFGNYQFTGVAGGAHTLSEVLPAGWGATEPLGGSYAMTLNSANFAGGNPVKNFGNFKMVVFSGNVFRDRNNNGVKDLPQDDGIAGVVVYTTQADTLITDANGNFSFSLTPKGVVADTVRVVVPAGFTATMPVPVTEYPITLASGGSFTAQDFGMFQSGDVKFYRTFSASEFEAAACAKVKLGKQIAAGKTPVAGKNYVTMANVMTKAGAIQVGMTGVDKGGKPWLLVMKLADLYKTFCDKSITHATGPVRGFDITDKNKVMMGKFKSVSPNVKKDALIREVVALQVNLALSVGGFSPSGLGALKYSNAGNMFDGMTIDQIADEADTLMSDWGGVPYATYVALTDVLGQINGAFTCPTINNDTVAFNTSGTVTLRGCKSVMDVTFLKANPSVQPKSRHITEYSTPVAYALNQNYPNPFNPTTAIGFDLPQASIVTVKVYNLLGQEIATLIDHERFDAAGSQEVTFDATGLASGVYLYRIQAETINDEGNSVAGTMFTQVKKMVLLK